MPRCPPGRRAPTCSSSTIDAVMKYSKNPKLAKDFLRFVHKPENFEKWFTTQEGYSVGPRSLGEEPDVGDLDEPLKMFRTAAREHPPLRLRGAVHRQSDGGLHEVHHHRHVRQGRPGHEGEDAVKWAEGELKKIYDSRRGPDGELNDESRNARRQNETPA